MEYSIYKFLNISTAVLYGEVTTVSNRNPLWLNSKDLDDLHLGNCDGVQVQRVVLHHVPNQVPLTSMVLFRYKKDDLIACCFQRP